MPEDNDLELTLVKEEKKKEESLDELFIKLNWKLDAVLENILNKNSKKKSF